MGGMAGLPLLGCLDAFPAFCSSAPYGTALCAPLVLPQHPTATDFNPDPTARAFTFYGR